jgi:hypothetical protein
MEASHGKSGESPTYPFVITDSGLRTVMKKSNDAIMSQLSLNKFSENLPVSGTIGLTQAVAGLGLGLLIADKLSGETRRRAGSVLLVAGALALAPVIASVVSRVRNRPHSTRRAQRQLDSIREDVGFHDSEHLI